MNKLLFAVVALVLAVAALDGCSPVKPGHTLRVVRNLGGRAGFKAHVEAWKSRFEKENPGWTMEIVNLGNSDGAQVYKTHIATNDLPEIVQTWALTPMLADAGQLQPLPDDFYTRHGIPPPAPYKGKRYTSQTGVQLLGIAVNKKLWADAGVTGPPKTWDEFVADLKAIKAKGIRPLVFGGKEWSSFMPLSVLIQQLLYPVGAGESWTAQRDAGKVKFATDPKVQEALRKDIELLDLFVEKGALSDGYNEEQADFYGGKAATWIMGCWIGGDLEIQKVPFDVDYWPLPAVAGGKPIFIAGGSGVQNGWAITTSAKGEAYDKAVKAFDAFFEPDIYQLFLNAEAQLKIASKVEGVTGPKSDWPQAQRFYDVLAVNYKPYGTYPGALRALDDQWPPSFDQSLMRVTQEILSGNRDLAKLTKMLDDDWDSARKAK